MEAKRWWFGVAGALVYLILLFVIPPFARPFDLHLYSANLDGFVQEWWSFPPFGTYLLPAIAVIFALLHLGVGLLSRGGRSHLVFVPPLLFLILLLLMMPGDLSHSIMRFILLKASLFGWLATGTLAYAAALNERIPRRMPIAAGVIALLYVASGYLTWPIIFLLLLAITLYWGMEALLSVTSGEPRAVVPLVLLALAYTSLLAVLLLERYLPSLHPYIRLLPSLAMTILAVTPSIALVSFGSRQLTRLHRNLVRERENAKRTLNKEVKRLEAEKREAVLAVSLELNALKAAQRGAITQEPEMDVVSGADSDSQPDVEPETAPEMEETPPVMDEDEKPKEAPTAIEEPDYTAEPVEEPVAEVVEIPQVDIEEAERLLDDIYEQLKLSRSSMNRLSDTLEELIGKVVMEEKRVASPLNNHTTSTTGMEENLYSLRTLLDLPIPEKSALEPVKFQPGKGDSGGSEDDTTGETAIDADTEMGATDIDADVKADTDLDIDSADQEDKNRPEEPS